jgi:uncharacterized protein (TIGR02118 family)
MTVKLVVLYTKPDDPEAFDAHYRETHEPLARKIPGLQRFESAHLRGAPDGGDVLYHQIVELSFADQAALDAAFASAEGQEAAADYGKIAPEGSRMLVAEVAEVSVEA